MTLIIKTVIPFSWNAITLAFTQGVAGTVNLAQFLVNAPGKPITYSLTPGSAALSAGMTLAASGIVTYNGVAPVAASTVQFRAASGQHVTDSAPTVAGIQPPATGTPAAPVWQTAAVLSPQPDVGVPFSFTMTATDANGDPISFVYAAPPIGTVTVNAQTMLPNGASSRSVTWAGTCPDTQTYLWSVDARDTPPLGQVTGVTATALSASAIRVAWAPTANATLYTVEKSLTGTSGWTSAGTATISPLDAGGLNAATRYYFRVTASNALESGSASAVVNTTTLATASPSDWLTRSTDPGNVWAHGFEHADELIKHTNPARNGDGGSVSTAATPIGPRLLTAAEDGEIACLDITQLGGVLAASLAPAAVPLLDYPTATLTATPGATVATLSLPLSAASLGIVNPESLFYIVAGDNAGIFCDIQTVPVTGADYSFDVQTSLRTPFVGSQTGLQLQHVRATDPLNPYEPMVVEEYVDDLGKQTWPAPTGWSAANPTAVPADCYSVLLHYDDGTAPRRLWKEKVTVVKKAYNATTKLSTFTVRRAASDMGYDTGGTLASYVINRFYPCAFPAGTLVGKDITGGWNRPLAPLVGTDNGLPTPDAAVGDSVTRRQMYNANGTKVLNYRTGYYGHHDYHAEFGLSNPFTPNTIAANGVLPFSGDEFYFTWKMKLSPMMATRSTPSKLIFIDQFQNPDTSQIVIVSPCLGRDRLDWFHNYGSSVNSDFPIVTWPPPLGQWFAMRLRLKAGHDNRYSYKDAGIVVTGVSKSDANLTMTITAAPIALAVGLTIPVGQPSAGRYWASAQNPAQTDPQRAGYYDNWKLVFKSGTVLAGLGFKVLSHTVAGGVTTFVVTKNKPGDAWPSALPAIGDGFRLDWVDIDTSCRYRDSLIEWDKKQVGDSNWVQLASFNWGISFNQGNAPVVAGNPAGWNEVMPTGYANLQDDNPPGSHSVYSRFAQAILSHTPSAPPLLP